MLFSLGLLHQVKYFAQAAVGFIEHRDIYFFSGFYCLLNQHYYFRLRVSSPQQQAF
jgi:hypothetical protein